MFGVSQVPVHYKNEATTVFTKPVSKIEKNEWVIMILGFSHVAYTGCN